MVGGEVDVGLKVRVGGGGGGRLGLTWLVKLKRWSQCFLNENN